MNSSRLPFARASVAFAPILLAVLHAGCGGKTELLEYAPPDAGDAVVDTTDGFVDTGVDTGLDTGIDSGVDTGVDTLPDTIFDVPPDVPVTGLTIAPTNAVIFIDLATAPPTPATQAFKVTATFADGTVTDVTPISSFTIDKPVLGTFAGAVFNSVAPLPVPGIVTTTHVTALALAKTVSTPLSIAQLRRTGDKRDFYFVVPYLGAPDPARDVLKFSTTIKQADVAFSLDTTGSMGTVIATMKSSISDIITKLGAAIPSVAVSISGQDDFPYDAHGTAPDLPFYLLQAMTTDIATAKAATAKYPMHSGGDWPEAQYEAIYQILTGEGVNWPGGSVAKHTPAPGTSGGVDFRTGSLYVVVVVTDAEFHNQLDYRVGTEAAPHPHSVDDVKAAYLKTSARHVGVAINWDTTGGGTGPYPQDKDLAQSSGSYVLPGAFKGACGAGMCCTGVGGAGEAPNAADGKSCLLVYKASYTGTSVPDSIVSGITALAAGTSYDVTAIASNDPGNPGGVDATKFIKALRAMDEGDVTSGCPAHAAKDTDGDGVKDTFIAITVGTPVCFEVLPKMNDSVPPSSEAQFFDAFIDVVGLPGSVKLDRRTVLFFVPPK